MAGKDRTPILCADGKGSPVPPTAFHHLGSMYSSRSLPLYIRKAPFRRDTYTSSIMSSMSFVISSSYDASIVRTSCQVSRRKHGPNFPTKGQT